MGLLWELGWAAVLAGLAWAGGGWAGFLIAFYVLEVGWAALWVWDRLKAEGVGSGLGSTGAGLVGSVGIGFSKLLVPLITIIISILPGRAGP